MLKVKKKVEENYHIFGKLFVSTKAVLGRRPLLLSFTFGAINFQFFGCA